MPQQSITELLDEIIRESQLILVTAAYESLPQILRSPFVQWVNKLEWFFSNVASKRVVNAAAVVDCVFPLPAPCLRSAEIMALVQRLLDEVYKEDKLYHTGPMPGPQPEKNDPSALHDKQLPAPSWDEALLAIDATREQLADVRRALMLLLVEGLLQRLAGLSDAGVDPEVCKDATRRLNNLAADNGLYLMRLRFAINLGYYDRDGFTARETDTKKLVSSGHTLPDLHARLRGEPQEEGGGAGTQPAPEKKTSRKPKGR
jgi:hypothetical protein